MWFTGQGVLVVLVVLPSPLPATRAARIHPTVRAGVDHVVVVALLVLVLVGVAMVVLQAATAVGVKQVAAHESVDRACKAKINEMGV